MNFTNMLIGIKNCVIETPNNEISTKNILNKLNNHITDDFFNSLSNIGVDNRYSIIEGYEDYLIGKKNRKILDSTTMMSSRAVNNLIDESEVSKNDIGMLIAISNTPDRLMPCMAYEVLAKSGERLNKDITVLNLLFQGCSTINKAIDISQNFCESNTGKKVIIVIAESHTGYAPQLKNKIHKSLSEIKGDDIESLEDSKEVISTILFGDASCAMLLDTDEHNRLQFTKSVHQSVISPKDTELLTVNDGGVLNPLYDGFPRYRMDKRVPAKGIIYVRYLLRLIEEKFKNLNITIDDIDQYFLHTGSKKILTSIEKFLGIDNTMINKKSIYSHNALSKYANLSAASVPIMLCNYFKDILLNKEQKETPNYHLMFSFGVGFSASSCIIKTR